MIAAHTSLFKSEGGGCTAEQRREAMLKALAGCRFVKKRRMDHPEKMKKVSVFTGDEWKNRGNHYRMCLKKARYRSESEAKRMIMRIHRHRPESTLRCYWCNYCNGWHLTHANNGGINY